MNIFNRLFGPKKSSAAIAKERLQIIVAHERNRSGINHGFDLQGLQSEIIAVIAKYLKIERERVNVQLIERDKQHSIFELNVELPESL